MKNGFIPPEAKKKQSFVPPEVKKKASTDSPSTLEGGSSSLGSEGANLDFLDKTSKPEDFGVSTQEQADQTQVATPIDISGEEAALVQPIDFNEIQNKTLIDYAKGAISEGVPEEQALAALQENGLSGLFDIKAEAQLAKELSSNVQGLLQPSEPKEQGFTPSFPSGIAGTGDFRLGKPDEPRTQAPSKDELKSKERKQFLDTMRDNILSSLPEEQRTSERLAQIEEQLKNEHDVLINLNPEEGSVIGEDKSGLFGLADFGRAALSSAKTSFLTVNRLPNVVAAQIDPTFEIAADVIEFDRSKGLEEAQKEMTQYEGDIFDDLTKGNFADAWKQSMKVTGESIPYMAAAAGASALGGPAAGIGAMSALSAASTYLDVKNEDWFKEMSSAEQSGFITAMGLAEGLGEYIGGRVLTRVVKQAAKNIGKEAAEQSLKEWFKGWGKASGLNLTENSLGEGVTGVVQDASTAFAKGEDYTFDDAVNSFKRNAVSGAGMAVTISAGGASVSAPAMAYGSITARKFDKQIKEFSDELRNVETKEDFDVLGQRILKLKKEKANILKEEIPVFNKMPSEDRQAYAKAMGEYARLDAKLSNARNPMATDDLRLQMAEQLQIMQGIEEKYMKEEDAAQPEATPEQTPEQTAEATEEVTEGAVEGTKKADIDRRRQEELGTKERADKINAKNDAELAALGDVSEKEYNDFLDKGIVSEDRINSLANKIKNNEPLSQKETAIFNDKVSEINKRLKELAAVNDPTETLETTTSALEQLTPEQKSQELIEGVVIEGNEASVAEAYQQAKQDGGNPELVQAVESLIKPETDATKEPSPTEVPVGEQPTTSQEVREQDPQGQEAPTESEKQEIAERVGRSVKTKPKNVKGLLDVMSGLFGLNKKQAEANAVVGDILIGNMAKRAGVTKDAMYQRIAYQKAQAEDLPQGVKFQVDAWHGSPYQFDKFTTEKIGAGEGAQAFGWGLYFTDLKDIARNYAKVLGSGKIITKYGKETLRQIMLSDRLSMGGYNAIIYVSSKYPNIANKDGFLNALASEYEKKPSSLNKILGEKIKKEDYLDAYKYIAANVISMEPYSRNLYKVSLHKGKTPDQYTWLNYFGKLDKPIIDKVIDGLIKGGYIDILKKNNKNIANRIGFFSKRNKESSVIKSLLERYFYDYEDGGRNLQEFLAKNIFKNYKDVSIFLLENGIDGIKYPAESISRGATSDTARGFNYVVFDENAVSIEEAIKFQKDAEKARGAMMVAMDNQAIIYALTDPNVSTPLHELAHVYEHYLSDAERSEILAWAGTDTWTTETSEKFARGFERYLAEGKAPNPTLQDYFDSFKNWLTEIYNNIVGSDIDLQLNSQMKSIYDQMLATDEASVKEAQSQVRQASKAKEQKATPINDAVSEYRKRIQEGTAEPNDFAKAVRESLKIISPKDKVSGKVAKSLAGRAAGVKTEKQLQKFEEYAKKALASDEYTDNVVAGEKNRRTAEKKRKKGNLWSDDGALKRSLLVDPAELSPEDAKRYKEYTDTLNKTNVTRAKVAEDTKYFEEKYIEQYNEAEDEAPTTPKGKGEKAKANKEAAIKLYKESWSERPDIGITQPLRKELEIIESLTDDELSSLETKEINALANANGTLKLGYLTHEVHNIIAKIEARRSKEEVLEATSDKKFKTLLRDTLSIFGKRGSEAYANYISKNPLNRIGNIIKGVKGDALYKNFVQKASLAYSSLEAERRIIDRKTSNLMGKIPRRKRLETDIKMGLISLQKRIDLNPNATELSSVEDIMKAIAEAGEKLNSFRERAEKYKEFYDAMEKREDGTIDWEAETKKLPKPAQQFMEYMGETYERLGDFAAISAARNGSGTIIYNAYTPLNVVYIQQNTIQNIIDEADAFSKGKSFQNVPESQRLKELKSKVSPIFLEASANFQASTSSILKDYYMRKPLKTINATINGLLQDPKTTADQYDLFKAIEAAMGQVVRNQFIVELYNPTGAEAVYKFMETQGYQGTLTSAFRTVNELLSNFLHALALSPRSIGYGALMAKNTNKQDVMEIALLSETSQFARLFQGDVISMEESFGARPSKGFKIPWYTNFVSNFNNMVNAAGDNLVAYPFWLGAIKENFNDLKRQKKQLDEAFDVERFLNDKEYRERNIEDLRLAARRADGLLAQGYSSFNPYETIPDVAYDPKDNVIKRYDKFLTRFQRSEFVSAVDAINAIMGRYEEGGLTREQGVRLMIATIARMASYQALAVVSGKVFTAIVRSTMGLPPEEEDDKEEAVKVMQRGLLSTAITLLFLRRLGNIGAFPINIAVEVMNMKFGEDLGIRKEGQEYGYDNALAYSAVRIPSEGRPFNADDMFLDAGITALGPVSKLVRSSKAAGNEISKLLSDPPEPKLRMGYNRVVDQQATQQKYNEKMDKATSKLYTEVGKTGALLLGLPLSRDFQQALNEVHYAKYPYGEKDKPKKTIGRISVDK